MNKNRKTSHILNVFQFDANGHVILPATLTIGENPHSSDNTSKIPSTSWIRTYVTGLSYLTGNQSITVSGDATGSGTTAITLTLANTAVTPGTYGSTTLVPVVTVDSKGRITSVTTAAISGSLTFTGDVTGSGTTGTSTGLTLAASGVTAGTYTKVTVDSKGRVTVGANASTTDISEGTNLYYTDTRVGTYLTANSYATQSYVGTQIANLVASAPATLDTLNELAAALGNDPSFATTVSTSIGTKVPQTRTLTINGTAYDLSADRAWTIVSMIYPSAGIAISTGTGWGTSITDNSANWNTAYGWGNHAIVGYLTSVPTHNQAWSTITSTPTTISGYGITNAYTDAQIQNFFNGANAITGYNKSNWDTAYGWGNHASGGYLTGITSSQVTTALGYTPYNSTNPSGYITGITSSNVTTALGYTPYNSTNPSGYITGITSGNVTTALGFTPYNATNPNGYITSSGNISGYAMSLNGYANQTLYTILDGPANGPVIKVRYDSATANRYIDIGSKDGNGVYSEGLKIYNGSTLTFTGYTVYHSGNLPTIPTNNNQLTNGAGYITSITSGNVTTALGFTPLSSSGSVTINGDLTVGVGNSSNIYMNDGDEGQRQIHCNSNRIGFLTQAGAWGAYCDDSGNWAAVNFSGSSSGTNTGDQTNISGNAGTVTNATFYRQFTVRDDRSDGGDYNLSGRATGLYAIASSGSNGPGHGYLSLIHVANGGDVAFQIAGGYNSDAMYFRGTTALQNGTGYSSWRTVIHSGNIGSQTVASAGNATTAGGLAVHTDRNNEANKIVRTDVNGYIQAGWINTLSGDNGTSAITRIYASDDGYIRYYTPANFRQVLDVPTRTGGSASGSWSINAATATGQQSGAHFTLNTGGGGYGLVGVYNPDLHQGFFAMGSSYTLGAGGTLANFYGVSWSYDYSGRQLNTGYNLQHCMAVANAGVVATVIGLGIWTNGTIRANGAISAGGTITGSNLSGTNTGDQTNISGRAGSTLNWYATSHPNDYYLVNNWTGTYWRITSNHPSGVQVAYADTAGSAPANGGTSSNTNSISNALGNTHTWTGAQNNFLGNGNTGGTNNVGMIVYSTGGNGSQFSFHRSGAYAINMGLDSDNVIRIGGWSASPNRFQMDMSGNLTMSGDVTAYSDARVKENIATIENALNKVLALRGVSYNRIDSDDKKTKIGVIAQETLPIVPEVVNQDNDGMFNVSYGNLAGLFIEAIKEQQKEIEELKTLIYGITR